MPSRLRGRGCGNAGVLVKVWHEKWGEDYARDGDACLKWTDRWSETMLPDGRQRSQGDKWREEFGQGNGNKTGETWHADENGHRCAPAPGTQRMAATNPGHDVCSPIAQGLGAAAAGG